MKTLAVFLLSLAMTTMTFAVAEAHKFRVIMSFPQFQGRPQGPLLLDTAGNMYGVTQSNGLASSGVVFRVTPEGALSIIHTFGALPSGIGDYPIGGLIAGSDGTLYGATGRGSDYFGGYCQGSCGTVYSLTPEGDYKKLGALGSRKKTGVVISGPIVRDNNGNIYAVTYSGGSTDCGVLIEFAPSHEKTVLFEFGKIRNTDCHPSAGLAMDNDGNLYGTTLGTGQVTEGVAYKFNLQTRDFVILHDFGRGNGVPEGVSLDSKGNLYGRLLGPNQGSFYRISRSGIWENLHFFGTEYPDGTGMTGELIRTTTGALFGITAQIVDDCNLDGCDYSIPGVIFRMKPSAPDGAYSIVHQFAYSQGMFPTGGLVANQEGHLFGVTSAGGKNNAGTIFEYDPPLPTE